MAACQPAAMDPDNRPQCLTRQNHGEREHTSDGARGTEAEQRRNSDDDNPTCYQEAREFVGFYPLPEVDCGVAGVHGDVNYLFPR